MKRSILEALLPAFFSEDFLWGAGCASHQGHGSRNSNWGKWEVSERRILSLIAQGKITDKYDPRLQEYICANACESEKRYKKDFALLKSLGHNAHRLSINWATVEPVRGKFDKKVLRRYRSIVREARKCGIEPIVTLDHWTRPMWFEYGPFGDIRGWTTTESADLFETFVAEVLPYINDYVDRYTVLNEPTVFTMFGYEFGSWPPQVANKEVADMVLENVAEGHRRAYAVIKRFKPRAQVGIAHAVVWETSQDPAKQAELDKQEGDFIERIIDHLDFIGINNYFHTEHVTGHLSQCGWEGKDPCTDHPVVSDAGWGMCPRALGEVLKVYWKKYKKPLIVTEHGHAVHEMDDRKRCWHLWNSLHGVYLAIQAGVDVRGYLHWSFIDNFEWAEGFTKKFGLIFVDRKTQKRTPRVSAYLLRDIILAGGLTKKIAYRYRKYIRHPHEK